MICYDHIVIKLNDVLTPNNIRDVILEQKAVLFIHECGLIVRAPLNSPDPWNRASLFRWI